MLSSLRFGVIDIIPLHKVSPNSLNIKAYFKCGLKCDLVYTQFQECILIRLHKLTITLTQPSHQQPNLSFGMGNSCSDSHFVQYECFLGEVCDFNTNGVYIQPKPQNSVKMYI